LGFRTFAIVSNFVLRISDFLPSMSTQLERKLLIFTTAALAGLGLLMVYSSSITARPSFSDQKYLTRQLMFMAAGVVAAALAARVPVDLWRKAAVPLLVIVTALLVAVLIPGMGSRINGAQRWFRFASISVQPSELAKVSLVLFLAWSLERKGDAIRRFWKGWLPLMLPPVMVSGLVLIEPDFGTAVFLMAVAVLMLYLAGVPIWHMVAGIAAAVPAIGILVLAQPYRVRRIFQFLDGWSDPAAAPYQVQQSLVALGSGGLWGTGLGQGWQKLGFLPEANTDFVFAVVGEELGLVGTLTVLALWGTFLVCGVRLARMAAADRFAYFAALGLIGQSVFQAALNIGVVTGSLPPKGISLPFISAGGSNLIISLVSVGMVLGMTRKEISNVEIRNLKQIQGAEIPMT
jgi:cell division protein FtsW